MGVPQSRERVFFIALRKDLSNKFLEQKDMFTFLPKIEMEFNEPKIVFKKVKDGKGREISEGMKTAWNLRKPGDLDFSCTNGREFNKPNSQFNQKYLYDDKVCGTLTAK